jgi:hypothetical protein
VGCRRVTQKQGSRAATVLQGVDPYNQPCGLETACGCLVVGLRTHAGRTHQHTGACCLLYADNSNAFEMCDIKP